MKTHSLSALRATLPALIALGLASIVACGSAAVPQELMDARAAYANAAKYFAGEAGHRACETAMLTHGGMGYAKEFHVERYFREAQIGRIAPVMAQLILSHIGERVLGLPKSY